MNKLSKLQQKLLKYIIENSNVVFDSLLVKFDLSKDFLIENLTYLRDLGLIEKDTNFRGFVNATILGKNYFEFKHQYWFELFIKSILCPIIVSFITTLVTLWLKGSL